MSSYILGLFLFLVPAVPACIQFLLVFSIQ